jgi:hypothetical protein
MTHHRAAIDPEHQVARGETVQRVIEVRMRSCTGCPASS